MRAFLSNDRAPSSKQPSTLSTHSTALPPPYQLAIEGAAFRLTILDNHGTRDYDSDRPIAPPAWFCATPTAPVGKRFLYLVQQEIETGLIVLLLMFDRSATADDGAAPRLPPNGAWLRAVVDGPVYVLASDLVLSRKSITAWLGGSEPPTTPAQPPYT